MLFSECTELSLGLDIVSTIETYLSKFKNSTAVKFVIDPVGAPFDGKDGCLRILGVYTAYCRSSIPHQEWFPNPAKTNTLHRLKHI